MTASSICSSCGAFLAPNMREGECPSCLIQLGVEAGVKQTRPSTQFTPPGIEELCRRFAELKVVSLIGAGGMGAVYRAVQTKLDRVVALKILPPQLAEDPSFSERFLREAHALAKLNHPHVVTVYDTGQRDDLCYMVLEYVDGANLRTLLHEGRLTAAEALRLVPQICDAMQYAHDHGIVHRDIKPENVLIDKNGRVKIADFGLAKISQGDAPTSVPLTSADSRLGTMHYMAPEQFANTASVDRRADIYSLGVMFYEMLTGDLPTPDFQPPSKKADVDPRVDKVVARSLKDSPDERYQQAVEVKRDVELIATSKPLSAGAIFGVVACLAALFLLALLLLRWPITSSNNVGSAAIPKRPTKSKLPRRILPGALEAAELEKRLAPLRTEAGIDLFEDSGQKLGEPGVGRVSIGDFDRDGDLDALVAQGVARNASIKVVLFVNDGHAHFEPRTILDDGVGGYGLAGDLDGDGDLDLLMPSAEAKHAILRNDGTGNFVRESLIMDVPAQEAVLADIDGDGDLDVVFANMDLSKAAQRAMMQVWLNDGQGHFTDSQQRLGEKSTRHVALADLDGDGDLDLFQATFLQDPDFVWLNDGKGQFTDSGQRLGHFRSKYVVLGDLDGDGDIDAAVAGDTGASPGRIYLNDGKAHFTDTDQSLDMNNGGGMALADFDRDGDLDIVEVTGNAGPASHWPDVLWLNDGYATFKNSGQNIGNGWGTSVGAGDFDADGDSDLFIACFRTGPNEVWLNRLFRVQNAESAAAAAAR